MLRKKPREKQTLPFNERCRRYTAEKNEILPMCMTQEEVDRALFLLRKKWGI